MTYRDLTMARLSSLTVKLLSYATGILVKRSYLPRFLSRVMSNG